MRLAVVVPVFNDWQSLSVLVEKLDQVFAASGDVVTLHVVNDGSTTETPDLQTLADRTHVVAGVRLINLALNMGHQRAIAIGLCVAVQEDVDSILVMDSDGEDLPADVPKLLLQAKKEPNGIIVARRAQRQEGHIFKAAYVAYRALFRIFVGKPIRFGNFSLLPKRFAERMVLMPELWNNLAAALLRSRVPIVQVPLNRGKRYAGRSQMSFTSLVSHGFGAISAYAETIFVRLLFASGALFAFTIAAVITSVGLRLFAPAHATPGWATTVSFGMVIVLLQVVFVTLTSMLTLFNGRVQTLVIPMKEYRTFVASIVLLQSKR